MSEQRTSPDEQREAEGGLKGSRFAHAVALMASCALLLLAEPAGAVVLRNLDFQTPSLLKPNGDPYQWENYVPDDPRAPTKNGTSGITLGDPGVLPYPYVKAARFKPELDGGRPRSMAKLAKHSTADPDVRLAGPLDAANGLDRYYSWYTYFPADFDIPSSAPKGAPTVLHAWHNDAASGKCNPNSQMHVKRVGPGPRGMHVVFRVQGGRYSSQPPREWTAEGGSSITCFTETNKEVDLGPVVRKRWILWSVHVRWSSDPALGTTEVWRDGHRTNIPGANLYRSDSGVTEQGFMEHGIYMPVEPNPAGRARSVWSVGMRLGNSPRDLVRYSCNKIYGKGRHVRVGGRRLSLKLSRLSTSGAPAQLRITGSSHAIRRAALVLGKRRYHFRAGSVSVPPTVFEHRGRHALRVRITRRGGRTSSAILRVRSRPCP